MRGVSADVGWFFSFPGRESKANDQNSKNVPSRATRPTFATESHEKRLSTSKQYRLISERQKRFLDRHPEYLEAARRKAEEASGSRCGS
jgi:hypothetical protein